jgi:hypothetical protein
LVSLGPNLQRNFGWLSVRQFLQLKFGPSVSEYRPPALRDLRSTGIVKAQEAIAIGAGKSRSRLRMKQQSIRNQDTLRLGNALEQSIDDVTEAD